MVLSAKPDAEHLEPRRGTAAVARSGTRSRGSSGMVALFMLSSFLTASLLFLVQPMVGRMVLPAFGGSPQVWTTSMLFFQLALLLGYGYTHLTTTRLPRRTQPWVHLGVAALPLAVLPITLTVAPSGRGGIAPSLELLTGLTLGVAGPFILIATSGPLVQRWFSWTSHPRAGDPYFLYAAGNIGSAAGLLAYPFVLEPWLGIDEQSAFWARGYIVAVVLLLACALVLHRSRRDQLGKKGSPFREAETTLPTDADASPIDRRRAGRWILLAFIPSSLMLAVTTLMSTDIAAVPLLWVVPLSIYLLTFTVAFSGIGARALRWATFATPVVVVAAVTVRPAGTSVVVALTVQSLLMLVGGTLAHGLLAQDRPSPRHLTRFYLLVAVGGALGGVFNGLIAPLLFPTVLEYGFTLVLLVGLVVIWGEPVIGAGDWSPIRRVSVMFGLGLLPAAGWLAFSTSIPLPAWGRAVIAGILLLPLLTRFGRSGAVGVAVALTALTPQLVPLFTSDVERTFFGVHRIHIDDDIVSLSHGTTIHGTQDRSSPERQRVPLTYYHPDQPLGDVFAARPDATHIGGIGLGSGSIAAYGRAGQRITFHEIDPAIVRIAQTSFTYLEDSPAQIDVVLGDGRLTLAELEDEYDVLVVDAFTSDAIPVHLLTVEAIERYLSATTVDGIVAINISNRYLDLLPVITAASAELDVQSLFALGDGDPVGAAPSIWVAMARSAETLRPLVAMDWEELPERQVLWTDRRAALWEVVTR